MILFETATTVYKSLHGLAPDYMQLMFTKLLENGSRSLRNTKANLEYLALQPLTGNSDSHIEWNKLSTEIKNASLLATFQNLLKESLKNQRM